MAFFAVRLVEYRAFDGVFRFADVARPGVAEELVAGFGAETGEQFAAQLACQPHCEVFGERQDVLAPGSQPRQRDDIEG